MPIYEYQCQACGELHEALQKITDAPLQDCPLCGRPALKKKVSAAAFRLKGGGWYETDFKSDKRKNVAGDAEAGADKSGKADKSAGGNDAGTEGKSTVKDAKSGAGKGSSNNPA
jgi:putative FmdB family regulatory protein